MSLINVKPAYFDVPVYNDAGSGAKKNLATWKPNLDSGWYYLGPTATNSKTSGGYGVVVQPTGDTRLLAPVTDWELVWSDAGSGKSTNYALWRGLPALEDRVDFEVIGGFFVRSHQKPTAEDARGMRAIHKSLLLAVNAGKEVWTDAGTGATANGAVWDVSTDGFLQAVNAGVFVPIRGHNDPPRNAYALNREAVNVL